MTWLDLNLSSQIKYLKIKPSQVKSFHILNSPSQVKPKYLNVQAKSSQVILGTNEIVKSSRLSQVNTWPTPTLKIDFFL